MLAIKKTKESLLSTFAHDGRKLIPLNSLHTKAFRTKEYFSETGRNILLANIHVQLLFKLKSVQE